MKKIIFSVDDGNVFDLKIAELLEKYGFTGIFYIAPFFSKIPVMTVNQIRGISKKHEIGGHTLFHFTLPKLSTNEQIKEILNGKKELEEIIGKKITKFAYPRGHFNEETKKNVELCGFREARTMKVGITNIEGYSNFEIPVSAHLYPRLEYKNKGIYQSIIDKFSEGNYFNLVMHGEEIIKYDLMEIFEKILIYIKNENKNS